MLRQGSVQTLLARHMQDHNAYANKAQIIRQRNRKKSILAQTLRVKDGMPSFCSGAPYSAPYAINFWGVRDPAPHSFSTSPNRRRDLNGGCHATQLLRRVGFDVHKIQGGGRAIFGASVLRSSTHVYCTQKVRNVASHSAKKNRAYLQVRTRVQVLMR